MSSKTLKLTIGKTYTNAKGYRRTITAIKGKFVSFIAKGKSGKLNSKGRVSVLVFKHWLKRTD
jgi:hypothetical protein